jgi:uncharacterized protein YndB with AHSA1/START domain
MKRGTKAEVSRHIGAPPETLYALITDVRRMPEWSPECRACEWIAGSTGASVGARFKGANRRGLARWTTEVQVLTARDGREFAFVTFFHGHEQTKWTYRFQANGDGTTVSESFELLVDMPWYLVLTEHVLMGIRDRKADLEAGMQETLRRLERAV